ncbi:hypothetical protein BJV74DRAFT_171328 [Russula compacta]|nr:hypothetical protein BJV74DRAFT_171328 [Russula compacta]
MPSATSRFALSLTSITAFRLMRSACPVGPGSEEDVGRIYTLRGEGRPIYLELEMFCSRGFQIVMEHLDEINVDTTATIQVQPGLTWNQVWAVLGSYRVFVIGRSVPGAGVSGLILSGSFPVNTTSLIVDNIVGYEPVTKWDYRGYDEPIRITGLGPLMQSAVTDASQP